MDLIQFVPQSTGNSIDICIVDCSVCLSEQHTFGQLRPWGCKWSHRCRLALASEFSVPLAINCRFIFVCLRARQWMGGDMKSAFQVNTLVCWIFPQHTMWLVLIRTVYIESERLLIRHRFIIQRESCSRGFISSRLALNQQLYVRDSRAHFIPRWWPIDRFLSISWLADCTHHVADYGCVSSFIHHRAGRRREIFIYYMGTSLYSRDFGRAESIADRQNRDERICQRLIGMFQWRRLELFSGAAFQKYRNFLL